MSEDKLRIGGQAVFEGVMMRGSDSWSVAVRKPDGTIKTVVNPVNSVMKRFKFLKLPLLRGMVALVESMVLGVKAISISTEESFEEEELSGREMYVAFAVAIVLAVGLFVVLPLFLTRLAFSASSPWFYWFEGLLRIFIFVAYIAIISMFKELRRVFEYHGAEHMTIHAYEDDVPLEPGDVAAFSPLHMRCGTSFLLIVMVIAVLVLTLIGKTSLLLLFASRLIVIPLIAGISYEVIRFAGRHHRNPLVRTIMLPGLALQKMTTRRPDLEQIEVAIAALKAVRETDEGENENLSMP